MATFLMFGKYSAQAVREAGAGRTKDGRGIDRKTGWKGIRRCMHCWEKPTSLP